MFLHLGGDVVVPKEDVIAILNAQLTKKNEINKEFMNYAEEEGFIDHISENNAAKSIIITTKRVYLSPISSVTLKKRSENILESYDE